MTGPRETIQIGIVAAAAVVSALVAYHLASIRPPSLPTPPPPPLFSGCDQDTSTSKGHNRQSVDTDRQLQLPRDVRSRSNISKLKDNAATRHPSVRRTYKHLYHRRPLFTKRHPFAFTAPSPLPRARLRFPILYASIFR